MSQRCHEALWISHEAMPKVVDAPLPLIFRMWQLACDLHLRLLRRPTHSVGKDVTMQPFDCRMHMTKNGWRYVDAHINHIETASWDAIFVYNESFPHYRHSILRVLVFLFASRSYVTSQFLSTSVHAIWLREDMALSHSCAPGLQLMACSLFHKFLVNIARLRHHSSSSSFSSISMTHYKEFEISQPCAQGLWGQ